MKSRRSRSKAIKTYEYQARDLLARYDIPVPKAILTDTAADAAAAVDAFGGEAMLKGQVLTGGRGKAGAVRATTRDNAEAIAREILALSVKGLPVTGVLVTEKLEIQAEYYVGLTVDRQARAVGLIVSAAGGVEIEQIAQSEPEKIRRVALDGSEDLTSELGPLFADEALTRDAVAMVEKMHRLFREQDCSLVEINPLVVTPGHRLIAADAKIVVDDSALWKHPDVAALRNPEENSPEELEAEAAGLSFVSLDGDIGCMVNGAGLAMATMDGIKLAGGSPANFLDVGGSSNPQKVLDAMRILLGNEAVKVILVNIFGGITRCDDIARGLLMAREQLHVAVPMVIRLVGTNEAEGRALLEQAGLIAATSMTDAIALAVKYSQSGASA